MAIQGVEPGCHGVVFPAGTWVSCGAATREPVERIRWAGAETAAVFCGCIDESVRAGQRAAEEVIRTLD